MTRDLWDPSSVITAVQAAGQTWSALPKDRGPAKLKAAWPETLAVLPVNFEEFRDWDETRVLRDELGMVRKSPDGLTALTDFADSFKKRTEPSGAEIDHAIMVMGWNQFFAGRTDWLDAVWLCHGSGFSTTDAAKIIARRHKMPSTPSRHHIARLRDEGIRAIVYGLNKSLIRPVPNDLDDRSIESVEAARLALVTALEALQPLVSALATGDVITRQTVAIPARHLYKAAQASAKILKALGATDE